MEGGGEIDSPKIRGIDRTDGAEAGGAVEAVETVVEVAALEEIMTEELASPGNPTLKSKLTFPP